MPAHTSISILCETAQAVSPPRRGHELRYALWVYIAEQRKLFPRPIRGMNYGIPEGYTVCDAEENIYDLSLIHI